jgi:alkylhydroperoxidase/carboxymuconolactone decarboxylase family protein YurZ
VKTQELINTAVYATVGAEGGTRTHSGRAYQAGATPAEIRQAILLCLGVGLGFSPVYRAMEWVRQELEEQGARE